MLRARTPDRSLEHRTHVQVGINQGYKAKHKYVLHGTYINALLQAIMVSQPDSHPRQRKVRRICKRSCKSSPDMHSATLRNRDRLGSSQPNVRGSFNLKAQVSTLRLGPEGSRLGLGQQQQHAPRERLPLPAGPGHRRAPSVTAESTAHFLSNLMMMSSR
jgi:hypothetical protein